VSGANPGVEVHNKTWIGTTHSISLIGRHESNGTEHTNGIFMGHLRRLVHDERLTHRWASDTVLPLINHALAVTPNAELGGLSPAELKFGTLDYKRFKLPQPLPPGHNHHESVLSRTPSSAHSAHNDMHQRHRPSRTNIKTVILYFGTRKKISTPFARPSSPQSSLDPTPSAVQSTVQRSL
jgi:hypothetical protein